MGKLLGEKVHIPPSMANLPDVMGHFKRKFYKRYIDPDLVVEPMLISSSGLLSLRDLLRGLLHLLHLTTLPGLVTQDPVPNQLEMQLQGHLIEDPFIFLLIHGCFNSCTDMGTIACGQIS